MAQLKLPIGIENFKKIRTEGYYYVDKTHYITKVENTSRFFFFVRPRRFGKSLFLSMLSHYYDINQKDKFDKIFGELYIGKHPTPDRNKYLVLALNFSSVASSMERLEESFNTYCKIVMTGFAERNAHLLGEEAVEKLRELKTGDAFWDHCAKVLIAKDKRYISSLMNMITLPTIYWLIMATNVIAASLTVADSSGAA